MGAVYVAVDETLNRKIALKVMLPTLAAERTARERFLREARATAQLTHDNVVTIFEAAEFNGLPFLAMQYLKGCSLDEYLKKKGPLALTHVMRIGQEVAAGLAAAHAVGMIHRDIKPGNLWLEAPNGRIKILDFGLAKSFAGGGAEIELTQSGAIVGTPAYMSPEQARGEKLDSRSDLFSLGGVLYHLCTGRLPFTGPNMMAVLTALATADPPPIHELNPSVPAGLAALIHKLLAKRPGDRPQSAAEVIKTIDAVRNAPPAPRAGPQPAPATPNPSAMEVSVQPENVFANLGFEPDTGLPSRYLRPPKKPIPKKVWLAGGVVAAVVLLGVMIIKVFNNDDQTPTEPQGSSGGSSAANKGDESSTDSNLNRARTKKPISVDFDRRAAEWVLSIGGAVDINEDGQLREIKAAANCHGRVNSRSCVWPATKR